MTLDFPQKWRRKIPQFGGLAIILEMDRRAFGVREDTVRLWRSDFVRGGVEGLKANAAPGPAPVKSEAALRVVTPLLEQPVADRRNWTIPRLQVEIEACEGVRISRSQLSKALQKKVPLTPAAAHAEGAPSRRRGRNSRPASAIAQAAGRGGRHRSALRRRERGVDYECLVRLARWRATE